MRTSATSLIDDLGDARHTLLGARVALANELLDVEDVEACEEAMVRALTLVEELRALATSMSARTVA